MKIFILFASIFFLSPACAQVKTSAVSAHLPGELLRMKVLVRGVSRTYAAYLPASLKGRNSWPVVIGLHGGLSDGDQMRHHLSLENAAEKYGFLAVFPEAGRKQWNDGRPETESEQSDVEFIKSLANDLGRLGPVDSQNINIAGISNGGMMALRLACEASSTFRAFAVVSANFPEAYAKRCRPERAVPILFIHGDADPLMPWDGGAVRKGLRGAGGNVASLLKTAGFWSSVNGCSPKTSFNILPVLDSTDPSRAERITYLSCQKAPVVVYKIRGGGHDWPGAPDKGIFLKKILGPTSRNLDANAVIAQFFGLSS